MKVVLVRHGEPDYSYCISNGFFGMGLNLAALSNKGMLQAEKVSDSCLLNDADMIVSSPYTRALQTAAVISRRLSVPLLVENDLHEWTPDLEYCNSMEDEMKLSDDFLVNKGRWPNGERRRWENIDMFSGRIVSALNKYVSYNKIIIVTHAAVIYHLTGKGSVPFCGIEEIDFTKDYKPVGWFVKTV